MADKERGADVGSTASGVLFSGVRVLAGRRSPTSMCYFRDLGGWVLVTREDPEVTGMWVGQIHLGAQKNSLA